MKTCSVCREDKPRDQFHKDARRKDGLFPQCKPCRKPKTAAYQEANRERINAYGRARTAANPGRSTAGVRAWRKANPEAAKILSDRYVAARRARMVAADYEPVNYARVIAAHQDCYLCGQPLAGPIEVDHVVPLARGGAHQFSNLMPTHACCNNQKGARLLEELTEPFHGPNH